MLTATHQSMTLYKSKCCLLPEKLTYTFAKRKNKGLVLFFKAHYSREHQASHSTRKHLRSQSVLQAFTFFPVLGHSQVPTLALGEKLLFSGKCSGQKPGVTQHQLHIHTHLAHSSHYSCHSSDSGSELSALSTQFLSQRTPALQTKSIYNSTAHSLCTSNSLLK